jgi:dCTP deaminase
MSIPLNGGLLPDHEIRALCQGDTPMISPFHEGLVDTGVISYGLSSFGYDAKCGYEFWLCRDETFGDNKPLHPKDTLTSNRFVPMGIPEGLEIIIPPHGFALTHTEEVFTIPDDVLVICLGKSTYARLGLIVNVTPLEPGWSGQVTLELSNTTGRPVAVIPGEGICQFLFLRGTSAPEVTYKSRGGKYMNQRGVTFPTIKR